MRILALISVASASVLCLACSASGDQSEFGTGTGGQAGTGGAVLFGGSGGGGGSVVLDANVGETSVSPCPEETQFVYTVTSDNVLYRFDPKALEFHKIGELKCPNTGLGTPFSMSVDRKGIAWVVFTNGRLFWVNTKDAKCTETEFLPKQYGFETFGMGFSSNAIGSTEETLYVSQSDVTASITGLAKIDTNSLELSPIDGYDKLDDRRAEMTGTGDARLFGAFEGEPYAVAEIDKATAKILSQADQNEVKYSPGSSNFAFAFWGGDFWLFVGPGTKTDVFQYKPLDKTTSLVKTVQDVIVGAGVSTCAPLKPPA